MTVLDSDTAAAGADPGSASRSTAASRARQRRDRRHAQISDHRLTRSGRPVRAARARLPFVLVIMGLLAAAIVGVLWLTTMTDEAGLRASSSKQAQAALEQQIEAANRDVASLGALPNVESQARAMGMIPAGDPAILKIGPDGAVTVIGTPTPAQVPTAPAPTTPAPTTPAPTTPAPSATAIPSTPPPGGTPAVTPPARATPTATTTVKTTAAVKITAAVKATPAVKTTPGAKAAPTAVSTKASR